MADYAKEMDALKGLLDEQEQAEKQEAIQSSEGSQIANMLTPVTKPRQGVAEILLGVQPADRSNDMDLAWSGRAKAREKIASRNQQDLIDRYKALQESKTKGDALALQDAKMKQDQANFDKKLALDEKQFSQKMLAEGSGKKKNLTAANVLTINEGNAIPSTLADIKTKIDVNRGLFGPVEGRIRQNNPYDTKSQVFDADIRAASQQFGRFMEGGVLRTEDEKKYRKMFPNLSDTPDVAYGKLKVVEELMRRKQKSDLEALSSQGYDMAGLDLPAAINMNIAKTNQKPSSGLPGISEAQADESFNYDDLKDDELDKMLGL